MQRPCASNIEDTLKPVIALEGWLNDGEYNGTNCRDRLETESQLEHTGKTCLVQTG